MGNAGDLLFYRFGARLDSTARDAEQQVDEVESVVREVTHLLNTRSPFSASDCAKVSRRTVVDYGLADFLHFSPLGRQDAQRLASLIYDTITAYEPRLRVENVTVETPRPCRDVVCAVVSGHVRKRDRTTVPVSFPVRVAMAMHAE